MTVDIHILLYAVIAMLILIVDLLCVPRRSRKSVAKNFWISLVIVFVAYEIWPFIFGTVGIAFARLGWKWIVGIALGLLGLGGFAIAWISDVKDNRAIRAGSKEAFDRRVTALMRDPNYSHEKAIQAVERIRERK